MLSSGAQLQSPSKLKLDDGIPNEFRPLLFLTSIGFALCIASLSCLYVTPIHLSGDAPFDSVLPIIHEIFFFGSASLTCFVGIRMSWEDEQDSHPKAKQGVFTCLALAVVGCAGYLIGYATTDEVAVISSVLSFACIGACLTIGLMLWGTAWSKLDATQSDERSISLALMAGCAIAGSILALASFIPDPTKVVVACVCLVASLPIWWLCIGSLPNAEPTREKNNRNQLKFFMPNMLQPLSVGFSTGIFLVCDSISIMANPFARFGGCLLAASLVALFTIIARQSVPRFSGVQRLTCTAIASLMVFSPFLDTAFQGIAICLLLTLQCAYYAFHYNALVILSYHHRVTTPLHFFRGITAPLLGVILGILIGEGLILCFFPLDGNTTPLPYLVAVVVFLVTQSIAPYTSNDQTDLVSVESEDEDLDEAAQKAPVGAWRRASDDVCKEFALTPREAEVFVLLSHGRNAEHISKQLFIATSTVKTHAQRIYRKLSINSQQELIDMVEKHITAK